MRHKKNRKNPWCSPALVFEKFFDTRLFSNQRKALIRFSTALWDNKLSTENRDTPILCMNFIRYPKIFETPKCSPMYFFTTVRQKFLTKPWYPPPPIHESFLYQFFWNTDVFPYEFFRQCDTNCFRWKIEINLPRLLFIHKFFIPKEILKNRRVLLWSFPVVRDKKFSANPWYTPLLCMKNFYIRIHLKYRCVPLRILSALWKSIQGRKVISSYPA